MMSRPAGPPPGSHHPHVGFLDLCSSIGPPSRIHRWCCSGIAPTPMENLLIERILTCWLETQYCDALHAQNMKEASIKTSEFLQRRQDRAHRRFLSAVKTLAVIRRLQLPVIQVNIGEKQVNVAVSIPELVRTNAPRSALSTAALRLSMTISSGTPTKNSNARLWQPIHVSIFWSNTSSAY